MKKLLVVLLVAVTSITAYGQSYSTRQAIISSYNGTYDLTYSYDESQAKFVTPSLGHKFTLIVTKEKVFIVLTTSAGSSTIALNIVDHNFPATGAYVPFTGMWMKCTDYDKWDGEILISKNVPNMPGYAYIELKMVNSRTLSGFTSVFMADMNKK
jgi:hypothetical protein